MEILGLPWDCALILVVLALVPAWRGTIRVRSLLARPKVERAERMAMYRSTIATQWLATAIVAWRALARGWTAASLGAILGQTWFTIVLGFAIALALAITQSIGLSRIPRASNPAIRGTVTWQMLRKLMPQTPAELPAFTALVLTVGICEEFLFRGFTFAAFIRIFHGSVRAALLVSALLFAFGHLYQGGSGLISTFILGLIFGAARIWTGSLIPGIMAHAVTDLVAGVVGPKMVARAEIKMPEG